MNDAELMSALIVGVVVAFYFMFWRPDQKARERHKREMQGLRPGDRVVTTSNFIATIKDIQVPESGETRIWLELTDGVIVTALPGAILKRLTPAEASGREPALPPEQKGAST